MMFELFAKFIFFFPAAVFFASILMAHYKSDSAKEWGTIAGFCGLANLFILFLGGFPWPAIPSFIAGLIAFDAHKPIARISGSMFMGISLVLLFLTQ